MRAGRALLAPAVCLYLIMFGVALGADRGSSGMAQLTPVAFSDLPGWSGERQEEALSAFALSCARLRAPVYAAAATGKKSNSLQAWTRICTQALSPDALLSGAGARRFFETNFSLYRVTLPGNARGFLTGYYEPEVEGSLERSAAFPVPLYRRPDDLVTLKPSQAGHGLEPGLAAARRVKGGFEAYPTRAEIEAGALAGRGLELVYLRDPIEAFFIHIQGSARVRLKDGEVMRLGFAAKNGHPYSSIGKVLIERGALSAAEMNTERLRQWLAAHPDEAGEVMATNRSFIFFRAITVPDPTLGPIGAAGVQLTPQRSLAVDPAFHSFATPIWIDAELPDANGRTGPFRRLMIAQDTGSAITGAARGDIFFGTGAAASARAGRIRHEGDFLVLLPKGMPLPNWAAGGG